jgi:outer membrane receptor protein involved in Fe transport
VPEGLPETRGFSVYDLRTGFRLNHAITFSFAIKNLTDEEYVEPYNQINVSSQVLERGRSLVFGLTIDTN